MIYLKGNRWLTIFAAELTGSSTKVGWYLELTCCSVQHVSQGNGPVPLQVGVRITRKSTNIVLHKSLSDKYAAKTHKVLPVELLQLNSRYDTDQERFSVVWQTGYRTWSVSYREFSCRISTGSTLFVCAAYLLCYSAVLRLLIWSLSGHRPEEAQGRFLETHGALNSR